MNLPPKWANCPLKCTIKVALLFIWKVLLGVGGKPCWQSLMVCKFLGKVSHWNTTKYYQIWLSAMFSPSQLIFSQCLFIVFIIEDHFAEHQKVLWRSPSSMCCLRWKSYELFSSDDPKLSFEKRWGESLSQIPHTHYLHFWFLFCLRNA